LPLNAPASAVALPPVDELPEFMAVALPPVAVASETFESASKPPDSQIAPAPDIVIEEFVPVVLIVTSPPDPVYAPACAVAAPPVAVAPVPVAFA
jgi:hypothetical protein